MFGRKNTNKLIEDIDRYFGCSKTYITKKQKNK